MIGVGQDIQVIKSMAAATALREPGLFFTDSECAHAASSTDPLATFTGMFCAKEAVFKAMPSTHQGARLWTDIQLAWSIHGNAEVALQGSLRRDFEERGWQVFISISHSGDYASAVALIDRRDPIRGSASMQ